MTKQKLINGLADLAAQIQRGAAPPLPGYQANEWAFICGVASGAMMLCRQGVIDTTGDELEIELPEKEGPVSWPN